MKILSDPRLFNYATICWFGAAAIRWGCERNWAQMWYWIGAIILNLAVTTMDK